MDKIILIKNYILDVSVDIRIIIFPYIPKNYNLETRMYDDTTVFHDCLEPLFIGVFHDLEDIYERVKDVIDSAILCKESNKINNILNYLKMRLKKLFPYSKMLKYTCDLDVNFLYFDVLNIELNKKTEYEMFINNVKKINFNYKSKSFYKDYNYYSL